MHAEVSRCHQKHHSYKQTNLLTNVCLLFFAVSKLPTIETIENCMKLSPMIIQALWEYKSPFLQLPYITDDHLRMFSTKKRHIKNLQQFAQLKPDETRHILKHLSDFEYEQVMLVLGKMPLLDFSIRCEGKFKYLLFLKKRKNCKILNCPLFPAHSDRR